MISLPVVNVRCDGQVSRGNSMEPCPRAIPATLPAHGLPAAAMRAALRQSIPWYIGEHRVLCPECCAAIVATYRARESAAKAAEVTP